MRALVLAVVLMLGATGSGYVRRSHLPRGAARVTVVGGSRDRALHGKARRRARRTA